MSHSSDSSQEISNMHQGKEFMTPPSPISQVGSLNLGHDTTSEEGESRRSVKNEHQVSGTDLQPSHSGVEKHVMLSQKVEMELSTSIEGDSDAADEPFKHGKTSPSQSTIQSGVSNTIKDINQEHGTKEISTKLYIEADGPAFIDDRRRPETLQQSNNIERPDSNTAADHAHSLSIPCENASASDLDRTHHSNMIILPSRTHDSTLEPNEIQRDTPNEGLDEFLAKEGVQKDLDSEKVVYDERESSAMEDFSPKDQGNEAHKTLDKSVQPTIIDPSNGAGARAAAAMERLGETSKVGWARFLENQRLYNCPSGPRLSAHPHGRYTRRPAWPFQNGNGYRRHPNPPLRFSHDSDSDYESRERVAAQRRESLEDLQEAHDEAINLGAVASARVIAGIMADQMFLGSNDGAGAGRYRAIPAKELMSSREHSFNGQITGTSSEGTSGAMADESSDDNSGQKAQDEHCIKESLQSSLDEQLLQCDCGDGKAPDLNLL